MQLMQYLMIAKEDVSCSWITLHTVVPVTDGVPTELEGAMSLWMSPEVQTRQGRLLDSLNLTQPNSSEQQSAFDSIMNSILGFRDAS